LQIVERHKSKTNVEDLRSNRFYNKLNIENYHIVLSIIVAFANISFFDNYSASLLFVLIELCILFYFLIKKNITDYLGHYLIFLSLSIEFEELVGKTFYGFKNFRILGVNLGIMTLIPILLLIFVKPVRIKTIKTKFPHYYKFAIMMFFLNFIGVFFGLFQILVNDNNIQNMDNYILHFINELYTMIALPMLVIFAIGYILTWELNKIYKLKSYLISILVGVVASMVFSLVSGNYGTYSVDTLLVTNVIRYIPFMLIIPFYKNYKLPKYFVVVALLSMVLSLFYNATGKQILLNMLIPLGIISIFWRQKKYLSFGLLMLAFPVIGIIASLLVDMFIDRSILFEIKFNQAISMIKFWENNWLINMPLSPRIRIIELMNISLEYIKKPWFVLFGKGYMGSITDHSGLLGNTFILGSFSMEQWNNGTFYRVHETFNKLYLYHGIVGIGFYIYTIKLVFKNFTKSPWILVGGFWILMVYGYSVTMTAYGMVALLLGFIELDTSSKRINKELY